MQRIEELIAAIQEHGNPVMRAAAVEMVRVLLEVHRAGLAKMLERIANDEMGRQVIDEFAKDELISRLLLLHGLHPIDLETRVRDALDRARPLLQSRGAHAELLSATNDSLRIQIRGGDECHAILEQSLLDAAPDVLRLEFVDADAATGLLSLPLVRES
jgi:hypothetical protein